MQNFEIKNGLVRLAFNVDENNKVRLVFIGNKENFINKPATFVEAELSECDHLGNHCSKFDLTPFGTQALYKSHEIKEGEGKKELIIVSSDSLIEVETHFIVYDDTASFSIYNIVKNVSDELLHLEYISSFYVSGFAQVDKKPFADMNIFYATSSWHIEAQWIKHSFLEEGIYNGNDYQSMRAFRLNNTGSWSTKDFLPMIGVENIRKKQFLLGQIENNGSWHIELADFNCDYYLSLSGPEMIDNHFVKCLKNGETFRSVQATVALGSDFEEAIGELTKARRNLLCFKKDLNDLPTIFNDYMHATWDASTEELVWPLADLASSLGTHVFVMDAGWFAKGIGWPDYIGEWEEYSANFPTGGLKGTMDYIRSKGMKPGLWFEIENMGAKCPLASTFPDDYFLIVNGKRAKRHTRYCLNFANPKVYKWAFDLISDRIDRYGLEYIKLDYNIDTGVGNEYGADSLGEGLLKHNRAVIKWLKELRTKYPDLILETCASGGCRMDYATLSVSSIQSTSDQTDYRRYPYVAANALTSCIPEQAAVWAYPVNPSIKEEITDEVVIMNMVNAMLGRIHLASYINKLEPSKQELVKEGLKVYESLVDFKKGSLPIYPNGTAYFFNKDVVCGLINGKRIALCVWNTSGEKRVVKVNLSKYKIKNLKVLYPTTIKTNYSLENGDLLVSFDAPYGGRLFDITLE